VVLTPWDLESTRRRDAQSGRLRESARRGAGALPALQTELQIAATRLDGPQHAPNRSGRLTKSANGSVAYRALSEPREQRTRPDQADGTMTEATKRGPPRRPT
jgi:hypothetical protein